MAKPIAITGLGVVSPFGMGAEPFWEGVCAGRCAIGRPTMLSTSRFSCQFAAEAPTLAMAAFGAGVSLAVIAISIVIALIWPSFLMIWYSRADIREEIRDWGAT